MVRHSRQPYKVYSRKDCAVYQLKISTTIHGQRVQLRESTGKYDREEAEAYALKRFTQIIEEVEYRTNPNKLKSYNLDQAFGMFWDEIGQYHRNSKDTYSKISILTKEFPNLTLTHLTIDDFVGFVSRYRQQGKANATINRYLALMSAVFNLCKKRRVAVPDINVREFMLKEKSENVRYIPDWQTLDKIINAAAPHLKPIIYVALYTGLRKSDILNLKWDDIQGDKIVLYVKDCTHEGGKIHFVDLFPALKEILTVQPRINEYIFTYKGERIKDIKTAWHTAIKKAGVEYVNFHTLRHTCATWILEKTGNLKLVQQVLGHSDMRVTSKYAHIITHKNTLSVVFKRTDLAQSEENKLLSA